MNDFKKLIDLLYISCNKNKPYDPIRQGIIALKELYENIQKKEEMKIKKANYLNKLKEEEKKKKEKNKPKTDGLNDLIK